MKKAASIFLRADIQPEDVKRLALWLQNRHVTQYLNEDPQVVSELHGLLTDVPAPMLRYHFNQHGRFFLICTDQDTPIGFVKLRPQSRAGYYEIVFVVGDERLWGNGYGLQAVEAAQAQAFLEWRAKGLTAKIYHGNARSVAVVRRCGFQEEQRMEKLSSFTITAEEYMGVLMERRSALRYGN